MSFTAAQDLWTLLDDYSTSPTFAANASLDGEPFIKLIDDGTTLTDVVTNRPKFAEHGLIDIGEENLNNVEDFITAGNEYYRVIVDVSYGGQTTGTKLKALLSEIRKAINAENATIDREYYWKMLYQWNGLVQEGAITVIVDMKKEMVAIV